MDTLTMAELTTRVRAFAIQQRATLDKGEGNEDMAAHGYSATGDEDALDLNNVRCKLDTDHSRLCHNCDRTGHLSRDCSIPKDDLRVVRQGRPPGEALLRQTTLPQEQHQGPREQDQGHRDQGHQDQQRGPR
mmetsp:Transcript_37576/g.118480  ORF Transcript_37576/g.118480 Transcript_37576/m.118480 type:complete len:132 (+) Transcript_37576:760-1155(+)